jgi:hypothetical protein
LGFIKKRLAFLVEKQKKQKEREKKGAFSITRHRNLRGLDLVCINANFSVKNVILKRMKTVRGRIDANPDSEEKPKNEKRKIRARPVQHHKQSSQPSRSASKQISQPKDRQANNQQATRRSSPQHGNPASQPSSRPARRNQPTESQLQQSSSHSISHRANSVEGTVATGRRIHPQAKEDKAGKGVCSKIMRRSAQEGVGRIRCRSKSLDVYSQGTRRPAPGVFEGSEAQFRVVTKRLEFLIGIQKPVGVLHHDFVVNKRGCDPTLPFEM